MRRKQVMAMLLALSMAAANVAVMPAEAKAAIAVDEAVGILTDTTVKLAEDVSDESKIYIHADDVKDDATVTVQLSGETYDRIIYSKTEPEEVSAFSGAKSSEELSKENGFADNATSATLYLLKASVTDTISAGDMISVTVEIDSTAPELSTLTVGGKNVKEAEATVAETEQELVLEAGSDDSGNVEIAYATGTEALEFNEDGDKEQTWTPYDAEEGATITLAEGDNYVYVKLTDAVGNVTYVCSKKITVDTTVPSCTFEVTGATKIDGTEDAYNIDETNAAVGITLDSGDELTKVTVDGTEDSEAKDNKSVTLNKAGEHTIIVDLKHTANAKTATQSAIIKCYKKVNVSAASPVTKTYGDTYEAVDLYDLKDVDYQGTPTTKYVAEEGTVTDEDSAKTALESGGTAGLPTDAGTYWVRTTFPANGYFLENSVYTQLTIDQKTGEEVDYNGAVTVQATDTEGTTVDLAETVAKYKSNGDTLEYTAGSVTGDGSSNITVEITTGTSELVVKGTGTAVDADKDATIPVTVTGFTNYDSITVNVPVKVTKNAVANLVINAVDKTYDGTALTITVQADGASIAADDKLTIKVNDAAYTEDSVIDADTYAITAEYSDDDQGKTGYATKTVIVSKRALKVKFADTTVTEGTAAGAVAYPTAPVYDGLAEGQKAATTAAITLTSAYTETAKAGETFAYTNTPANTAFKVTGAKDADVTKNYEITVENGSVVVEAASKPSDPSTPSTPSTPSGPSSPSAPSGPSAPVTPGEKPGDGQTTTDTITITTNDEGETVIVNAGGETIRNDVVKIDGEKYITDEDGVVITDEFATTPSGSLVYADADGKLVTDQIFTVSGKKYVAKKSGALVVSGFAKTNHGSTVYCGKSGAVVRNKAFTVSGKKYVAKKSGALVKNAWVKVGNKKYYCGKNGVVTKTKKAN